MTAFATSPTDSLLCATLRDSLRPELERLEALVKAYVARWNTEQPEHEREKYWLLADTAVERFLAGNHSATREPGAEEAIWIDEYLRLCCTAENLKNVSRARTLMRDLGLSELELEVLLLCGLPDLDFRFRRWFQLIQGDASRCHLPIWRVLDILGPSLADADEARTLFNPGCALRRHRLVSLEPQNPDEGLLANIVCVDDRILSYLLGDSSLDARVFGILSRSQEETAIPPLPNPHLQLFCELSKTRSFQNEPLRMLLQSADSQKAMHVAQALARSAKQPLLEFDCARGLQSAVPFPTLVELSLREALLGKSALLFRNGGALLGQEPAGAQSGVLVDAINAYAGLVIVEVVSAPPLGCFPASVFIPLTLPAPSYEERAALWNKTLGSELPEAKVLAEQLAASFLLTGDQIDTALNAARNLARRERPFSGGLTPDVLFEACRHQTAKRLVAMAQRLEPRPGLSLDAVVLPAANHRQLEELRNRIRHRREVHTTMGYDRRLRLGRNLVALFAGPSGSGKTMAAEILASEQRCDLYKVDMSSVVSKWVGETEKNLNRIFEDAEQCQGMLFFDEADALFGHRGEVKEARDHWANQPVNFLLSRIEEFSGVVILATNLRNNIDPAFGRRFHSVVDFPQPDEHARFAIWQRILPGAEFVALDERDLRLIAARFDLSGGGIRNAVLDASYRAIENGKKIELRHITAAAAREYQKMGKPVTRSEFGESLYQIALEEVLAPSNSVPSP